MKKLIKILLSFVFLAFFIFLINKITFEKRNSPFREEKFSTKEQLKNSLKPFAENKNENLKHSLSQEEKKDEIKKTFKKDEFSQQIKKTSIQKTGDKNKKNTPPSKHIRYQPKPGISWWWQLSGDIDTSRDAKVYDIDLEESSKALIKELQQKGKRVICYFNAGAYEPYRKDAKLFPREVLGKTMEGWDDERWLDVRNYEKFAQIMRARLDEALAKSCDGVEPDNIDAYQNETGFPIRAQDQLKYNIWLSQEAHKRGLSIALKNDGDQIPELEPFFDFALNEECMKYHECEKLIPFIDHGKAVFHVEYDLDPKDFCAKAKEMHFSSLKMTYDLNGGGSVC